MTNTPLAPESNPAPTGDTHPTDTATLMPESTPQNFTRPDPRWPAGTSGNPMGRPKGKRNKITELLENVLDDEAEVLVRKVMEVALKGNPAALKLCIDRVLPPIRTRPMSIALPEMNTAADMVRGMSAVIHAAANGEIDVKQAQALATIFETKRKCLETVEFEERLHILEERALKTRADDPYYR